MKLAAIIAYGKENIDKATIGFTLVNAALGEGHTVRIILAAEGVLLAKQGYADDINNGEPFKPLKELMDGALSDGAELNVCLPCMKKRGLEEKDMLQGLRFIVGSDVIKILEETDKSLQL